MKKFFENAKTKASVIGAGVVVAGSNAMASSFTAPTLSTTEPTTVAVAVLAGLGTLWGGILKAVGVMKRG